MSGETGIRDLQTGLYTRDYFDEVIGRELERSRRYDLALSVLSVVISNQAAIRATSGEDVSSSTVVEAARTLLANVRESDLVFRWEEDEFVVLLCEADLPACSRKVQQLSTIFRPWREGNGPVKTVPVKVRIGASTHDKDIVFPAVLQAARAAARNQTQV
jgi:diguanylate cyclase (GGDEF)-like protein